MSVMFHLGLCKVRVSSIEFVSDVTKDDCHQSSFSVRTAGGFEIVSRYAEEHAEIAIAMHSKLIDAIEEAG